MSDYLSIYESDVQQQFLESANDGENLSVGDIFRDAKFNCITHNLETKGIEVIDWDWYPDTVALTTNKGVFTLDQYVFDWLHDWDFYGDVFYFLPDNKIGYR